MLVASNETEVVRVLFQILMDGDRRKMDAVSNDSRTRGRCSGSAF